ncbi:transposase [Nocardia farcinica]|uniref:transposase n=1 Tax=Nocardia farcinica TaxID=37329 RepID=UPI002454E0B3|nr:transposase [Nocardia farcinica]
MIRPGTYLMWKTAQILTARHGQGVVAMPSRSTFFRVLAELTRGKHTTGSARTRRSMASQPQGPYGIYSLTRPGELMEIDSTPLDVEVRLPNGVLGRVELTGMIDVATRTITAAVVRPTTKSVDASLLLARTLTPELMRPGWAEALRMSRSVLPYQAMLSVDQRLTDAAAAPVIMPEVIVCDQGAVFISSNFRSSCRTLGIDLQPAPPGDPTKKPHIERMMSTVATLFAQYLAGYLGSSTEHRGRQTGQHDARWSLPEVQSLLDEWLITWQNRPHDGLRDPLVPGRMFTPNEKYASLVQACGYVPVALGAADYIELLPAQWRAINHYGVRIGHRVYDGKKLRGRLTWV